MGMPQPTGLARIDAVSDRKDKSKTSPDSTIAKSRSLLKALFAISKAELTEALEAEKAQKASEGEDPARD